MGSLAGMYEGGDDSAEWLFRCGAEYGRTGSGFA